MKVHSRMHPIEPYLKNFLDRAYPESRSCNKIAQRYASHDKASRMYYNTSIPIISKIITPCLNIDFYF